MMTTHMILTDVDSTFLFLPSSSLFGWLVNRVNSIINRGERPLAINILDIFGFEDFPVSLLFWLVDFVGWLVSFIHSFYFALLHSNRRTVWNSSASIMQMRTSSFTSTSRFSSWNNRSTPRSGSSGKRLALQ